MCFKAGLTNLRGHLANGSAELYRSAQALPCAAEGQSAGEVLVTSITRVAIEELKTHRKRPAQAIGWIVKGDGFLVETRVSVPR